MNTPAQQKENGKRAEEILQQLAQLLLLHKAALVHKSDCIVLAIEQPHSTQLKSIAQVSSIAKGKMQWRPI